MNHIMVNVGIKSMPGISSSIKEKIPPRKPLLNPNIFQKIKAEIGAQINSPSTGITITALPIRSIKIQAANDGRGFCLAESFFALRG
jgi:hypothetical protein